MRDIRDMEDFARSQSVIEEIYAERRRQVDVEGWTLPRDDMQHSDGGLARAAGVYALHAGGRNAVKRFWPWGQHWWKPTTPRRCLVKAAALIVAEIERLDRLAKPGAG